MREDDRQALVLRYALNWSSARMAEVLGVSAAAVDMRLSRARRRLAELLREDGFPVPEGI
jgi:RNA polymerase sigma-70 factor (ECF subfamily)